MILPVVKALDDLSKDYKIEYRIIGPVTNNEVLNILKRPYITLVGEKDKYGLGEELKNRYTYTLSAKPCMSKLSNRSNFMRDTGSWF